MVCRLEKRPFDILTSIMTPSLNGDWVSYLGLLKHFCQDYQITNSFGGFVCVIWRNVIPYPYISATKTNLFWNLGRTLSCELSINGWSTLHLRERARRSCLPRSRVILQSHQSHLLLSSAIYISHEFVFMIIFADIQIHIESWAYAGKIHIDLQIKRTAQIYMDLQISSWLYQDADQDGKYLMRVQPVLACSNVRLM